jgi:glucokinase
MGVSLGIDLGGTKIAGVRVSGGAVVARTRRATPVGQGANGIINVLRAVIRELDPGGEAATIGVGSAGVVDSATGVVRSATALLPDWSGTPLRELLADASNALVTVVNDVHALAWAEAVVGTVRNLPSGLVVAVGTGVGGAIIHEGRVLGGRRGAAGHLGHVPSRAAAGRTCSCGVSGHVEAASSGPAMTARYQRVAGRAVTRLEEVVRLAGEGDRIARTVLDEGARALGEVLGGLVSVLDPSIVVLAGGVVHAVPFYVEVLRKALSASTLPSLADVPVERTALESDAAALGAALAAEYALIEVTRG